jgi:hypothetical protein
VQRYLNKARKLASAVKERNQVVALLVAGSKIIDYCINNSDRHLRDYSYWKCGCHAEAALVRRIRYYWSEKDNLKIYVYRFNRQDPLENPPLRASVPCILCRSIIADCENIAKIYCIGENENKIIIHNHRMKSRFKRPYKMTAMKLLDKNSLLLDKKRYEIIEGETKVVGYNWKTKG